MRKVFDTIQKLDSNAYSEVFRYTDEKRLIRTAIEELLGGYSPTTVLEIGGGQHPLVTELPGKPPKIVLVDPVTPISPVGSYAVEVIRAPFSGSLLKGRLFDAVLALHVVSYLTRV